MRSRLEAPRQRVLVVGGLATVAVATVTVLRVLYNVPFDPIEFPSSVLVGVGTLAAVLVGIALGTTAFATRNAVVRVGLLFAGVFGVFGVLADAAVLPAVVAITGGGALALAGALGLPRSYRGVRRRLVTAGFLAAIGISLATTTGIVDVGVRGLGTSLFLAALTLLVIRTGGDPIALVAGAVGFLAVIAASTSAPYLAGSALLVGFGVVDGAHLLVATAVFGGVAAVIAGLRRGAPALVAGATILLLAGAPATPGAAMAILLGTMLACTDLDDVLADAPGDGSTTEVTAE
ncbi:phosphate ABC transporter permease [Halopenitus sp. H-Gu1]|uniref:phosphate ABC transporter permease n=1 Tax=Halopenitus sp. H-Gu1 TaxID=3242697 RepID=UPI00359F0C3E